MNSLKIVVFILAMLTLTTQTVRHVYVRFIEPRTSVLDKYEQTETDALIKSAKSLDLLVTQYDSAKKRVDELDQELKKAEGNNLKDEVYVLRDRFMKDHKKECDRKEDLKKAIEEWEKKSKEILELRVFWAFGFILFLSGLYLQKKGFAWMGMSLIIPGIVEMIWWTSPSFRFAGSALEFDRLLMNKLVFTLVTIAILAAWQVLWKAAEKKPSGMR